MSGYSIPRRIPSGVRDNRIQEYEYDCDIEVPHSESGEVEEKTFNGLIA